MLGDMGKVMLLLFEEDSTVPTRKPASDIRLFDAQSMGQDKLAFDFGGVAAFVVDT